MMNEWTTERWEEAIRNVFRRAMLDPQFRQLALTDPRGAFAQANGGAIAPAEVKLRFVEQLDEHVLVLPKVAGQGSLSEIDLSRILHHAMRQQSIPPTFSPLT